MQAHTAAVIIAGPQGCGKTKNAEALAKHFGKSQIIDNWTVGSPLPDDALCLTQDAGVNPHVRYDAIAAELGISFDEIPKFCKDCRHFVQTVAMRFAECSAPSAQRIDLVHGPRAAICADARTERGACGPTAALFRSAVQSTSDVL